MQSNFYVTVTYNTMIDIYQRKKWILNFFNFFIFHSEMKILAFNFLKVESSPHTIQFF